MRTVLLLIAAPIALLAGMYPCAAGAEETVTLRFKDYDKPPVEIQVSLLSEGQRREALAGLRIVPAWQFVPSFPRPGLSEADRRATLDLARHEFDWLDLRWRESAELPAAELEVLRSRSGWIFLFIARIFSALGEAEDAQRLATAMSRDWPFSFRERFAFLAAYIEARGGTLETGPLAEVVKGPDDVAAAMATRALRNFGVHAGAERVAHFIQAFYEKDPDPDTRLGEFVNALLDTPPSLGLEPARTILKRESAEKDRISWDVAEAALYLLAWGDEKDRAAVEARNFDWSDAGSFAALCADPRPIWDGLLYADRLDGLALAIFAHSAQLPDIQNALLEYRSKVWLAGSRHAGEYLGASASGEKGDRARNNFLVRSTAYLPSAFVASKFYTKGVGIPGTPWIPLSNWTRTDLAEALIRQDLGKDNLTLLDYLPPAEARALATGVVTEKDTTWLELCLQAQATTTGGFFMPESWCFNGPQRRPYLLGTPGAGEGVLSGVAELAPALSGKTLALTLRLDQVAYYHRGDFISGAMKDEEFETWKYLQDSGRKAVSVVRVFQRGKELKVADQGAADGALVWEAELSEPSYSGVTVVVETDYFGPYHPLVFDLFASDAARKSRAGK